MYFYLRVTPSESLSVIISVSKKVAKLAVTRNQIRRRIRPIVARLKNGLKPRTYFIVAKPGAEKIKGKELENEVRTLFKL